MRIAVVHWGRTGGGPLFALELTSALIAAGEDVVVSYSANAEIAADFAALDLPSFALSTFEHARGALLGLPRLAAAAVALDAFLREQGVDVVIIAMEQIWQAMVAPVFRMRGRRTLLCVHDATMHPGDHSRLEHALRFVERRTADGAFVFSGHVRDALTGHGLFPADRIWTSVHPAYEVPEGHARVRAIDAASLPVIGFFGRLSAYKGLGLGALAVRELRRRGHRVHFHVVGSGALDAEVPLDHVDDELSHRWVAQSEVVEVMDAFDIVLLPYTEASQSGVLAYSMGLGVPAVVTPVGGLVEQVTSSNAGVVAESCTAAGVADAVERLLTDPGLYRECSSDGITAARDDMSWARVADDLRRALRELPRR